MADVLLLQSSSAKPAFEPLAGVRIVPSVVDDLTSRLLATDAPAMLIIDSEALGPRTVRMVEVLSKRKLLPQTAVWLKSLDSTTMAAAWGLAKYDVTAAFNLEDLQNLISESTQIYAGTPMAYLRRRFTIGCKTTLRLLKCLDQHADTHRLAMRVLAHRCGASRTALYMRVAAAGLPSPEHLQMLFRMWPAIMLLRRDGTLEESAAVAHFADGRSFRRALRIRFGQTASGVRAYAAAHELLDHWLALQAPSK
ncbi:MAG TPA: hypothetical protein VGD49_14805 [Longimicrobiales bacterium]